MLMASNWNIMRSMRFLLVILNTCLSVVFTYSTGAPAARCSSMLPNHGASPQSGDNYNIQISPNTYGCDSSTVVSVTMTSSAFKGFLCQARTNPSNDITSGTLTNVNNAYTTVNNCAGKASLTHDNNLDKTSIRMEWKPDLTKLDTVYIVCTIVETKMMFWTNQTSAAITFSGNSPCGNGANGHVVSHVNTLLAIMAWIVFNYF